MKEAVKILTLLDIIFVILLVVSGSLGSIFSDVVYFLAFLLPIAIGFYYSADLKSKREEIKGVAEPPESVLELDRTRLLTLIPLVVPTVAIVFLTSLLSSLLLAALGIGGAVTENEGIVEMILVHAVAPALFEEALFRYIPIRLLLPYSKRLCIIYSAFCFALIHCNLFSIPYAFVAGILFMVIDIALESVWPSVILHLINNIASVIWMKYCSLSPGAIVFMSILAALLLTSIAVIFVKRDKYKELFKGVFDKGEGVGSTYAPFVLAAICLYIAFANIVI